MIFYSKINNMYIIEAIPLVKLSPQQPLSYFSKNKLKNGDLITVKIRNSSVPAIVAAYSHIKTQKSALKSIPYALKPIERVLTKNFISGEFLKIVIEISDYFSSNPGLIFLKLIPKIILKKEFPAALNPTKAKISNFHRISLFQSDRDDRVKYYKSVIRENFAAGFHVFLCVPAIKDIEQILNEIQKGIENYVLVFHNRTPVKDMEKNLKKYLSSSHPMLIVSTGNFLMLANKNTGTIILEKEGSENYKTQKRPYLDFRKVAEIISRESKNHLICGDEIVRVETFHKKELNKLNALIEINPILESPAMTKISQIGLENIGTQKNGKKEYFQIFGEDLKNALSIKNSSDVSQDKILLFINKRGHSTTIVCGDCGKIIECEKCSAPFTLRQPDFPETPIPNKNRFLLCRHCFLKISVPSHCPSCGSWNLKSFGVGIQKVGEEIKKTFPQLELFRMDGDAIKNQKQGKEVIDSFFKAQKGVLMATELIFSFLERLVDSVFVVSADSLLALPDFRMNEKIFKQLIRLRSFAKKNFVIQTRITDKRLFENILKGNIINFYREETEARKKFFYPPFSTLIKITREEINEESVKKSVYDLVEKLKDYPCFAFPAFISKIKNKHRWNILLKLKADAWPKDYQELLKLLQSLPPSWKINVDPEILI
ncbi:MAG: hypothetical protein A2909_00770 [Candidatus Tagabacteria bacterium RIFCSPLOWO2_01_FULL_39_11]|uniref:Primosomal protein N C-terminal domain-containing protein n=1 Tax=Candidatus Tagabacteria bacterium RIFCSPLOWO2_01_FULL_39_11 TaxID=1802295 RepID=A0A1G2LPT2_9BACT|nr:MAG: hypothetical protein A2909_00770 [Candidatus Tagabacteria bacterium RIFCSPLOWO2_01_FULL_39_11]